MPTQVAFPSASAPSPRILLLADMPPCKAWTGGLVLHQMSTLLMDRLAACYCVTAYVHDAVPEPDLQLPYLRRRGGSPGADGRMDSFPRLQSASRFVLERTSFVAAERRHVREAVAWGKSHGITAVWAVLEGATMIRMALPVAQGLGVPLISQVWDPPGWWFRAHGFDAQLQRSLHRQFDATLRSSAVIMAASWNMADDYACHGVPTVALPACLEPEFARAPATEISPGKTLMIGMAGQLYAREEWRCLLAALEQRRWTIGGRRVEVKYFGKEKAGPDELDKPVEFCGWHEQREVVRRLAQCDVLFCPYWFDPAFAQEARQSFPSKLTSYLAAGRPVVYLGPREASPARFLRESATGLSVCSLDPSAVAAAVERLVVDPSLYAESTRSGRIAFDRHLSSVAMRERLDFVCARVAEVPTVNAARSLKAA